jgi:hypothetical protein
LNDHLAHRGFNLVVAIQYKELSLFDRNWILRASRDTETNLNFNNGHSACPVCLGLISYTRAHW